MTRVLTLATIALLLAACQEMRLSGDLPPNQPIAGHKFAQIHTGMTYGEFEHTFGDGWVSPSLGTDAKYWFFDDGRTLVVSAEVWHSPALPLKYRVIGSAPESRMNAMPILPSGTGDISVRQPH